MRIRYNNFLGNTVQVTDVRGEQVRIGRAADNDIVLDNPYIPERALLLVRKGADWTLQVFSPSGCLLGDKQIRNGESVPLDVTKPIQVFPFTLNCDISDQIQITAEARRKELDRAMTKFLLEVHLELLERMDLGGAPADIKNVSEEYIHGLEKHIDDIAKYNGLFDTKSAALASHVAGNCLRSEILAGLTEGSGAEQSPLWQAERGWSRMVSAVPEREREVKQACDYIGNALQYKKKPDLSEQIELVERGFWDVWDKVSDKLHDDVRRYLAQRFLKKEIKDIVFGYGPLEDLLRTPTVSEIMVVDSQHIYIEKSGVLEITGRVFVSDLVTESIIQRIVARVNKQIDRSKPLVDARLTDGSRVNAVIPPLAVRGPCLTIRKFPMKKMQVSDLIKKGAFTQTVAQFLMASVMVRCNIIVSGGTGSGKTTLLNCLSNFIPDKERIVTIEDTAELQLQKEHVVRLEAREANMEGAGAYTIRDLVKNSLRMRPDRLVIGECRAGEALDMLQAMNTGHDGSLTTIHANAAEDVMLRLEVLCQMAADLPVESIRRQIASAVDLIVQLRRLHDGSRRVVQVTEVTDYDPDTRNVRTKDIFALDEINGKPVLIPTGYLPTFMDELLESGLMNLDVLYR